MYDVNTLEKSKIKYVTHQNDGYRRGSVCGLSRYRLAQASRLTLSVARGV
ncbi:hypothetical protein AVEN_152634-1, partial [Araneus ventricosus]